MEEGAHEKLLHLTFDETQGAESSTNAKNSSSLQSSKFIVWLQIFIFTFFTLGGQAAGTLLGRVYYEQGGQSRWIATLAQTAGFPFVLPFICFSSSEDHSEQPVSTSIFVRASVYIFLVEEAEGTESSYTDAKNGSFQSSKFILWLQIFIFTFFTLGGQAAGTLLGRVYYEQGGQSRWIATLAQTAGFSILLPMICYPSHKNHSEEELSIHQPSIFIRASVYIFLGLFQVANSMLFTVGVQYLPASTYSLISGSQLAFNALTSFLINGQKITAIILNSVVILSFSSSAVIFQNESGDSGEISQKSLLIGFAATTFGSLGFALQFSLTELAFQKVFKSGTLKVVMKMSFFIGLFVTIASLTGIFASGDWRDLEKEMGEYRTGKLSYVINLVCTAIAWQLYAIGSVGLVFKASALFSNVIINLGTSIVPIFAVVFLKENMSGLKVLSLLLGLWGYASYIYQHYLDDLEAKTNEVTSSADHHDDF